LNKAVPSLYLKGGGASPQKFAEAKTAHTILPSNHSPFFALDAEPALGTGIKAEVAILENLLNATR
jgi:hypothetical protein